jgi:peroxiredoxin Q/BCP
MTAQPSVGQRAPDFSLPRDGGGKVTLADYRGRTLVLYFYPRADTPGCTLEAQDFSKFAAAFESAGAAVLGVSADPVRAQERFKQKYDLKLPLASDETHEMLGKYGVWREKSMYGRTFMGVERATYLIDRDGRIAREWRNVRVKGHVEEVLEAARSLAPKP